MPKSVAGPITVFADLSVLSFQTVLLRQGFMFVVGPVYPCSTI